MGKPIYRVIIDFGFKKKRSVRHFVSNKIDTFVNTKDEEVIKKDMDLRLKIARKVKRKLEDIEIRFKKIHIEGQYGETNH
tara:strand:+ start:11258 stop:11497 length:240 start_codon:yes stop_codon:yes gene_type:complete